MPTINLTAKGRDQELILAYLTENASDVLADKINNGVPFEKDGKQLVNRKDLNGFMNFACDEAKKARRKRRSVRSRRRFGRVRLGYSLLRRGHNRGQAIQSPTARNTNRPRPLRKRLRNRHPP